MSDNKYSTEKLDTVKIVRHETVKAILCEHYNEPEDSIYSEEITADLFGGSSKKMTIGDQAKAIEGMGIWGFARPDENEIHYWIKDKNDRNHFLYFISHELGHIVGKEDGDDMHEEFRANSYADVATKATEIADSIYSPSLLQELTTLREQNEKLKSEVQNDLTIIDHFSSEITRLTGGTPNTGKRW